MRKHFKFILYFSFLGPEGGHFSKESQFPLFGKWYFTLLVYFKYYFYVYFIYIFYLFIYAYVVWATPPTLSLSPLPPLASRQGRTCSALFSNFVEDGKWYFKTKI
jgi:hypothetical protein